MNKQGFAISSIIYTILILFLVLIFSILSVMGSRKLMLDKMKKDVMDKLNGDVVDVDSEPIPNLAQKLLEQYDESNTVGLLKDETGYYYKGSNEEVANNFVWFAGHLWRVISIDNDNNLTMITQQPITAIRLASAGWTTQDKYESSYINHWLNSEEDGVFYKSLAQEDKDKIIDNVFNIGEKNNVSSITTTQKTGLLDYAQYTKAGKFLGISDHWWLGNYYSSGGIIYICSSSGSSVNVSISASSGIRPVIKITNIIFTAGQGTIDDPYRESSKTTNISNIKAGEYISIPTTGNDCGSDKKCLFRVVSKDDNSIKVVLNGLLPSTSSFDSSSTYTSDNTIDTKITTFAKKINSTYRYTGTDKKFRIGTYGDVANYTKVEISKHTGNVGLPVIGELFSGNDIDISASATKIFVNVDIIENPIVSFEETVSISYWTMNPYSTAYVNYVDESGKIYYDYGDRNRGVRPVLFLNNNLTFTGGEGTAENPFTLE